jgi:hypothetical protein
MSSSTQSRLIALPADIQHIIFAAIDAPTPLFIPRYDLEQERSFVYGNLDKKHKEFYGDSDEERSNDSLAILHLSSTCSFYRKLLAPRIFEHVVLRTRPRSLTSCNAIRATDHWQLVSSLTVCGTYLTEERNPDDRRTVRNIDPLENFDFDGLSSVLSNLPHNLSKLVVDFPTEWVGECNVDCDYLGVLDIVESSEQTLELEATKKWRKLIFVVFDALTENAISSKKDFELQILNIPPLPCSLYGSVKFQRMLNSVSQFTLALSHFDNNCGWQLNTMEAPLSFASQLSERFWNHLAGVKALSIHADYSWPFGCAPGRCHMPLALPVADFRFAALQSLSLKWWFIDAELITLLNIYMPVLKRLSIENYFADSKTDMYSSEAENTPTWAEFFSALRKHPTLTHLLLSSQFSNYRLLNGFDDRSLVASILEEVHTIETIRSSAIEAGTWTAVQDARIKRIWPHFLLDGKYGSIGHDSSRNAERFEEGSDHRAWLLLCDALERRGGRCEVTDLVPPKYA